MVIMMMGEDAVCVTGIKELDDILGGGIPQGHCVLLCGSSGTGKTILTQELLFRGAKELDETGIYISLAEPKFKMMKNLKNFEFYDPEAITSYKVRVINMEIAAWMSDMELQDVRNPLAMIVDSVRETDAKRVVIDSITAIADNLHEERKIRDFIFKLGSELATLDCTSILISEIPPRKLTYSVFGVEEFIADGIIMLDEFERRGDLVRTLQVIKMRGIAHSRAKHAMEITTGGIRLVPMFKAYEE